MSRHSAKGRPWNRLRLEILAASDICWVCGHPGADTVDHLIPRAKGGTNDPANLAPAHGRCNSRRPAMPTTTPTSRRW